MRSNNITQIGPEQKAFEHFAPGAPLWPDIPADLPRVKPAGEAPQASLEISFTIVSASTNQTKTVSVGPKGQGFEKAPPLSGLYSGNAKRKKLRGTAREILQELKTTIEAFKPNEVLITAPHKSPHDEVPITVKGKDGEGSVARTREYFSPVTGPAIICLDFDDYPAPVREQVNQAGGLSSALARAFPAFLNAACLRRLSSSAGIKNKETGERSDGKNKTSEHRYFVASDGTDTDFAQRLFGHLVLAGFGFIMVSSNGRMLKRTIFDLAASRDPARLNYEADAILADPRLEHVPGGREGEVFGEEVLNTHGLLPLTEDERRRLEDVWSALEANAKPEADRKRAEWRTGHVRSLKRRGESEHKAQRTLDAALKGTLSGAYEIPLDDDRVVTVRDILANKTAFHKVTCADPIEPEYGGGRNKAVIYTEGTPVIFSHAHGGITYRLVREPEEFFERVPADDAAEPIDLFGHSDPGELSYLPPNSLPRVLETWSVDQARRKGTSEAFPAVATVTAAAGAIGNSVRIQVKDRDADWTEPAAIWSTLVADPGSTKSEIIKAALGPLKELEAEWRRVDDARHAEWAARDKARKKAPKAEIPAPIGPEPRRRRLTIDDVTAEAQIHMHASNPRGLIRAPDELAGMLDKMGAYKKGAGGDRSNLLRHFDGESISVDRVGGTGAYAEATLMGCLAGTQPEKLRPLVRELSSDGLLQRMLFFVGGRSDAEETDEEPDYEAAAEYRALLRYLAGAEHGKGARVVLSPGASTALKNFRKRCKTLRRLPGATPAWCGHLAKWDKFSARILLTFHCTEQWALFGAVMPEVQVDIATANKAVAFCNFILRHSLAFYEDYFESSAPASEARAIAGFLLTRPDLTSVTARDIYHARTNLKGPENRRLLIAAMEDLVDAGWCSVEMDEAKGPVRWKIDRRIHERFAERRDREIAERAWRQEQIRAAGEERRRLVQSDKLSDDAKLERA